MCIFEGKVASGNVALKNDTNLSISCSADKVNKKIIQSVREKKACLISRTDKM